MAEMKTKIPYPEISETLKKVLSLSGSPVAVKLARNREEVPAGIPEVKEVVRRLSANIRIHATDCSAPQCAPVPARSTRIKRVLRTRTITSGQLAH